MNKETKKYIKEAMDFINEQQEKREKAKKTK